MRSVPAELIGAAKQNAAQPYVKVELQDRYLGVPNLRWSGWYTGTEPEGPCAAAVPADGSLIRARIDPAGARIYLSRVASPTSGSTYSTWTNHDAASATPRLGLTAHTTRVLAAWYDGANIRFSDSSDSGATWSLPATALLVGAGVTAVSCAMRDASGSAAILYAVGGTVYALTRTGTGAWSASAGWTVTSLASVNGLAAMATADYDLVVSGVLSSGLGAHSAVYALRLGAGVNVTTGTWTALEEVALASAGTGVTLRALSLGVAHTPRILLHEEFTSGYGPVQMASGIADSTFAPPRPAEPRALDYTQQYGLGFAGAGTTGAFLVSARSVWHATIDPTAYDLSADVYELEYTQETSRPGRARLVLRNDDGRYAEDGAVPLHPQTQLTISPGYVTTSGPLASLGPRYYVERVTRRRADGRHVAIVEAVDAFGALSAWRAPRQLTWASGATTASLIATSIARRAGIDALANWSTEASVDYSPAFTLPAGASGLDALRRLLADLPDELRADLDRVVAFEPLSSDASGYSYGVDHPIVEIEVTRERSRLGWARVVGAGVRSERTEAAPLLLGGPAVIEVDRNLAVQARADARAATMFRQAANETARGSFTARPFVGLEVGDVIDITDATLGLAVAAFRVRALRLRYSTGRTPRYELRVELGEK